ncbi:tuftelin-interacting protein 11-like [Huso huso]|uniref:Tuftelin-interacting protein 11 n=1 Tax=Huso huso TaxID=61971 RepID=A0ABR0ZGN5_HUSHU
MSMSHLYGRDEEEDGVELERFEVTDWDLQNEFNPERRRHRQTKEEATYGMWAEHDSDDERPSFGGKRSKDYTAPVNFISAGLRKSAAEEREQRQSQPDSDDSDDMDKGKREERPRESGPRKLQTGASFKGSQKGFVGGPRLGQDFANWERHTRGIGQKLLEKMGYVPGRGLGKNAQGIINPIEAKVRKGKGAVGAYGAERTKQSLQDFPVVDSEEEEEKDFQQEMSQWRREPGQGRKKPKYSYRTVDELKAKGYAMGKSMAAPPTELAQVKGARRLQHERDVVVSLSHESETLAETLSQEEGALERLGRVLELVEQCERRLSPGPGSTEEPLSLEDCAQLFERLQGDFYEEYKAFGLADLAVAMVHPLLKEHFRDWEPLKDGIYGIEVIGKWRALLGEQGLGDWTTGVFKVPLFPRMLWEVWLPFVRASVTRWQPRNCGPMVDFLESWAPILPIWILENILEQLIFPKLQREVESWNPLTDTVPIHSWIHPWLPLMQAQLEPLYPPIRSKLASALQKWHPSDSSAKLILQPWRDVFTPGSWEAFMVKNIVPKLGLCLSEFVVNPHQQHMDPFQWVLDWEGMLSPSSLVGMLDKHFFPKWLQVLCSWLSNNPNYEEITKWYLGWKSMLSDAVLAHPSIKEKFNEALDIMNRSVSSGIGGYLQPGARENVAYLTHTERRKDFQYEAMQERREAESVAQRGIGAAVAAASTIPTNFKDLIQAKAEEYNIVFMPVVGKRHEGKQLYTFGRIVIYIDRGVVFVQGEKTWVPTSLQSLIDMAK